MKRSVFLLAFFIVISCNTTYKSTIPDFAVYLELDLNFRDKDLIPLQSHKIYTPGNITQANERTGFGGVLIYHTLNGNNSYAAFDAACPNEAMQTVTVEVEEDNIHAICPKCQTRYDLSYGNANPVSGSATQPLKRYTVINSGSRLIIRN